MHSSNQKWIILDRDGVINHDSDAFIKTPEEWNLIENSDAAIAKLNNLGYKVAVITNQSGIARKHLTLNTLEQIHQKMHHTVSNVGGHIDVIYFCPHGPEDGCNCRKPLSGMFLQLANEYKIDLTSCYALGDSVRDLVAAQDCGCSPVLLKTGKGSRSLRTIAEQPDGHWLKQVPVFSNLKSFTDTITA